jgi:hypothetical protein
VVLDMDMHRDECSGVVAHALATFPRRMHKAPDLRRVVPPHPDPLRGYGQGSLRPSGIMATTDICLRQGRMRNRAYLSISVTSSSGAERGAWRGDCRGIGAGRTLARTTEQC